LQVNISPVYYTCPKYIYGFSNLVSSMPTIGLSASSHEWLASSYRYWHWHREATACIYLGTPKLGPLINNSKIGLWNRTWSCNLISSCIWEFESVDPHWMVLSHNGWRNLSLFNITDRLYILQIYIHGKLRLVLIVPSSQLSLLLNEK